MVRSIRPRGVYGCAFWFAGSLGIYCEMREISCVCVRGEGIFRTFLREYGLWRWGCGYITWDLNISEKAVSCLIYAYVYADWDCSLILLYCVEQFIGNTF